MIKVSSPLASPHSVDDVSAEDFKANFGSSRPEQQPLRRDSLPTLQRVSSIDSAGSSITRHATFQESPTSAHSLSQLHEDRWIHKINEEGTATLRSSSGSVMTRRRKSFSRPRQRSLSVSQGRSTAFERPSEDGERHFTQRNRKKQQQQHAGSGESQTKNLPHYRPMHQSAHTSLLSRDSSAEGGAPLSFTGLRNLAMIVLVAGNLRLMVENYLKYGFILSVYELGFAKSDLQVAGLLTATIPCHLFFSLLVERFAISELEKSAGKKPVKEKALWRLFAALHALNATLSLCVTSATVYTKIFNPLLGTLCEVHALILGLKVVSYALTNRDLRDAYLTNSSAFSVAKGDEKTNATQLPPIPEIYKAVPYPENLSIGNLVYFWWAPTLVYQPVYPRTPCIRPTFLLRQGVELIGTIIAMWFLSSQYAMPILESTLDHLHEWNWVTMGERLLRLATVSIAIWLLGFFAVFQCSLNLLAELTQFADREFYLDWWNSGSVGSYWKLWNKPVNNYFVRHLYIPMLKLGWPQFTSSVMVFFVSAVLHEVLVGIPTHNVIGAAFLSMILQIPLILVTAPLEKMSGPASMIGNCIFWLSFFLGQPLGAMLYYLAYNLKSTLTT